MHKLRSQYKHRYTHTTLCVSVLLRQGSTPSPAEFKTAEDNTVESFHVFIYEPLAEGKQTLAVNQDTKESVNK